MFVKLCCLTHAKDAKQNGIQTDDLDLKQSLAITTTEI